MIKVKKILVLLLLLGPPAIAQEMKPIRQDAILQMLASQRNDAQNQAAICGADLAIAKLELQTFKLPKTEDKK